MDSQDFLQSENVQLSPPQMAIDSLLFHQSAQVEIALDLAGSSLYFSLDEGPEKKYFKPLLIEQSSHLRVQARKPGFQSSDWLDATLIKIDKQVPIAKVSLSPEASEQYPGEGANSLIDLNKGSLDFRAKPYWLGFQTTELVIQLDFEKMVAYEKLFLSFLSDHDSWIFLPQSVEVWHQDQQIGNKTLANPLNREAAKLSILPIHLQKGNYQQLKIKIQSLAKIPSWHAGEGSLPWLFIDEILMN